MISPPGMPVDENDVSAAVSYANGDLPCGSALTNRPNLNVNTP